MKLKLFLLIVLLYFISVSCRKEDHIKIERILKKGTWQITYVLGDSIALYDLPEKFDFKKCIGTKAGCDGTMIKADGKEVKVQYVLSDKLFSVITADGNSSIFRGVVTDYTKSKLFIRSCSCSICNNIQAKCCLIIFSKIKK